MQCPCIQCPEQGCGTKHDACVAYKKFCVSVKEEHQEANRQRQFMRHLWMPTKGQRGYARKYKGVK